MTCIARFNLLLWVLAGLSGCGDLTDFFGGGICDPADGPATGDLAVDIVGTWQDWTAGGSFGVIRFEPKGAVELWQLGANRDPTAPDATGGYAVAGDVLTISWDDMAAEHGAALLASQPGCTMLFLPSLRVPHELERVHCEEAAPPGAPSRR